MTPSGPLPALRSPTWRARAAAWALVALWGVVFAPWISRAVHATGAPPEAFARLCTVPGHASGTAPGHHDADVACALCVLAHAAPLTGAPTAPSLPRVDFRPVLAHARQDAGRPADAPPRALARAPPPTFRTVLAFPRARLA